MKRNVMAVAVLVLAVLAAHDGVARAQVLPDQVRPDDRDVARVPRRQGPGEVLTAPGGTAGSSPDESLAGGLFSIQAGLPLSLAGPVDPQTYRVGPGDVLLLQIWGKVTRTVPIEVGPEGTTLIPGSALVRVAGLTLAEVRADLLERMSRQYRGVSMDVRLARPRSFRVYLTGEVRTLGPTETNGTQRAADVLLPHILSYGASSRRIEVRHHDGTVELADLDLFLQIGDDSFNPWLRDGDVIQVPTATEFIWAQGAVARPGRYELGVRDSLRTLLRLAGDPLPAAELGRVLLIRFKNAFLPESIWFNLEDVYARRFNPRLEDGERFYVYFVPQYHQQHEVAVVGEVQRPGVYPIREGRTRLSNMITSAGGFQSSADLSAIRLHRRSPATGEKDPELDRLLRLSRNDLTATEYEVLRTKLAGLREVYRVDWTRLQGDKDLDLLLRNGDTVRVERLLSSIRVDGEVRRPGIITYVPGQSLSDCVRQAGGYTERAWRGKVRVTRAVTGQTLLARGVRSLDPGDFVWVPEKPDVTVWQQARDVLTSLAEVATIIIAIRSLR